jgi:hypothetical protein
MAYMQPQTWVGFVDNSITPNNVRLEWGQNDMICISNLNCWCMSNKISYQIKVFKQKI